MVWISPRGVLSGSHTHYLCLSGRHTHPRGEKKFKGEPSVDSTSSLRYCPTSFHQSYDKTLEKSSVSTFLLLAPASRYSSPQYTEMALIKLTNEQDDLLTIRLIMSILI